LERTSENCQVSRNRRKILSYSVAFIEGDGIGPEQAAAVRLVLNQVELELGVSVNLIPAQAGDKVLKNYGEALPEESFNIIKKSDCCLKGPVGQSAYDVIIRIRRELDLYANLRPAKALPRVSCIGPGTDLIIVRENTEDLYSGMETVNSQGATATRVITRRACRRIAKYAFELSLQRKKSVTAIHKVNVLKKTDGLFLSTCKEVSESYPQVDFSDMLVDAAAMNLIRNPQDFDVIVTTNMFGDILSDEAAQVVGGIGLNPSANIGDNFALFEPVHGSAPDIAGKNIANPTSLVLSTSMMLDWLGRKKGDSKATDAAKKILLATEDCLTHGEVTPDLGGRLNTLSMGKAIARRISR
jgi:3-isopropylmalate dehydrogenase